MDAYLYTFLTSIAPILELRASIPLGHLKFGLPLWEATVISILGVFLAASIVLKIIPSVMKFLESHIPFFHKIMEKIFQKTHARHSHRMEVVGEIALILFVAIPLPGSGAWTGALLAYLFNVKYKKALLLIGAGIALSGIIVALLTVFGNEVWKFWNGT